MIPAEAYLPLSECDHCAFVASAACPPLRELAVKLVGAYKGGLADQKPIEPCEKFTIFDSVNRI